MKKMLVSEFKAKCIGVFKEVRRSREPVLVTLRGEALAVVEPPPNGRHPRRLGAMRGTMTIHCDIVRAGSTADWEKPR